ncbi:hypothetical protein LTR85_004321 [Meristemomyces frigidus]|nr:hypothetical protein LTR85_004321 [Meristemomyces frigidus]
MDSDQHLRNHLLTEALQQRQEAPANLNKAPQNFRDPSSSSSTDAEQIPINHPASFDFPTLSPDGSVDDISTPPPAFRMADNDNMSDSTASLAEGYDMMDDVSSNDERETASLASTERDIGDDGAMTPEDAGSDAEEEHEEITELPDVASRIMSDTFGSFEDQAERAQEHQSDEENVIMDSLLTDEDLETPRQSTLATSAWPRPSPRRPIVKPLSTPANTESETAFRVLLVCDRTVPEAEKYAICTKITSSLAGSFNTSGCQTIKLPATPSGISLSSATIFRDGEVQLTAQQCICAHAKEGSIDNPEKYALHVIDSDGEFSSVYTIGGRVKPDMDVPQLAIIYSAHLEERAEWLNVAASAMHTLSVPVLALTAEDGSPPVTGADRSLLAEEFFDMDNHVLSVQLDDLTKRQSSQNSTDMTPTAKKSKQTQPAKVKQRTAWAGGISSVLSGLILFFLLLAVSVPMGLWSTDPLVETAIRREALATALQKMGNATDVSKTYNLDHLVPQPTPTSINFFGQTLYDMPYASYYQGGSPNHIVVSLTKKPSKIFWPVPKSVRVSKGGREIAFNQTKLIEGIHDVSINAAEAYGLVDVNMLTKSPNMNFTMQYNFGSRILQRQTYENAGTDVTKSINKDLIVARKAAKSLSEMVRLEIAAGAAATKNVTSQLAVQMTRDLQVFTNTAASVFGKIGQAGNKTASAIRKDVMLMQEDLAALSKSIRNSISSTRQAAKDRVPTKKTVISPLKRASDRAAGFRQKLFGREKDANSTSATKELSTYFQDFLKPGTTAKKPSKLRDIARCLPARDYNACKKAQATSLSAWAKGKSLSTVPGKGLTHKERVTAGKLSARDAKARQDDRRGAKQQLEEVERKLEEMEKRAKRKQL